MATKPITAPVTTEIAAGDPRNAQPSMVCASIRYVLPSTSGTLLRVPYPN